MKQYQIEELETYIQCNRCKARVESLAEIYNIIKKYGGDDRGGIEVSHIANQFGYSIQHAHRLLNILVAVELIKKDNVGDPTGGRLYRYIV